MLQYLCILAHPFFGGITLLFYESITQNTRRNHRIEDSEFQGNKESIFNFFYALRSQGYFYVSWRSGAEWDWT